MNNAHTPFFKKAAGIFAALLMMVSTVYAQTNYYVSPSGSDGNSGLSGFPKKTIQAAINAAFAGDIINVDVGTYNENVVVNKSLTVQGSGSTTVVTPTTACSGDGIIITANSTTVKDLKVTGFRHGVVVQASIVELNTIESISNCNAGVEMGNGISFLTVKNSTINGNVVGLRAGTGAQMNNITVDNCNVKSNIQGTFIAAANAPGNSFNNISIKNSDFSNNTQKGMYFEKLSNAVIENIAMGNSGTDASYAFNAGIDINLKHGNYSNITIKNSSFTGCGADGVGAHIESPVVLTIKARDDAPSYSGNPATLTNVSVLNNIINGPRNGIRFGEFGKTNLTPTNVEVHENDLSGPYANKTIINNTLVTTNATCNWYGTTNGATIAAGMQGSVNYSPYLTNGTDNSAATGFQPVPNSCSGCPSGNVVQNTTTLKYYCSIQDAINDPLTLNGHTITASAGTYNEDVLINKQLTLLGAGYATTTVSGPIGGGGATMQVAAAGVVIDGFTITRAGNNTTDWNNPGLNTVGVAVQGLTVYAEVRNSNFVGNRTGIDINNSNGNNIHNNIIDNNRTGMIFRNQTDNTNLQQNFITNNWTVGVLFLDASGGTNVPVQRALNSTFNNNNISGNWYGDVVDRQSGGVLPAPGTTNIKNFECNWYGSASAPVTTTSNSTEPGYGGQIPVFYGGTATAPGGQPNIAGPASANIDYTPWLSNGTDNNAATGFQPVPNSCSGCPSGNVVQNTTTMKFYCSIQDAINDPLTTNGHTITASAGTYNENININKSITLKGANYNAACRGGRGPESIINGTGGSGTTTVLINADGVTFNGFVVTNANGSFGIQIKGKSNVDVQYNIVSNVGNAVSGSAPSFGIYDQMPQAIGNNATNVNVSNNCVNAIRGGQNTALTGAAAKANNGSGTGIGFGDSQTQSDLASLTVNGNVIDNITACTSTFADGGKGAYGVIINIGAGATAVGKAISPQITNNVIVDLEGFWAHGVGLEGETPGAKVLNNYMDDIVDHKVGDAVGVMIESNAGAASVEIHENSFTNVTFAVINLMPLLQVDAECNWYGSASPAAVSAKISGNVDYTPWLTNGTDAAPAMTGFQPVAGSCNGNSTAPVITCPADKTIACGESTAPSNTGMATATTNCGSTTITYTDAPPPPACLCNYSFVRTWTAIDACGNQSSCMQTITVSGTPLTCTITVTPENNTYTGGVATDIYLGYGPQSATLTVNPTSGSSFTYVWSGPTAYLSCTTCQSPVFTPTMGGTYTYTVTVTNEYGCTTTCSVTFCVKNIRVPNSDKVYVCHIPNGNPANTNTLSVSSNAVAAHLAHGDNLGQCGQTCGAPVTTRMASANAGVIGEDVKVYPNPNNGSFVVEIPYTEEKRAMITVSDVQGKLIQRRIVTDDDGRKIMLNLGDAARGVYFIEVTYGETRFRTKLIVQ